MKKYIAEDFELNDELKKTAWGTEMLMPLEWGINPKDLWTVPTEPMITITGGHKIIRRFPNRSIKGGSIKERWSSNDYKVSIKGTLIDENEEKYPEKQVRKLREICEHKNNIKVRNPLFTLFGIERIVIDSFEIPFTKGLPMQKYSINAYSDQLFDSLLTDN